MQARWARALDHGQMPELALLAQLTLAVALVVSGVAKLVDRSATADALVAFGASERLRWAAPLLPITELTLALLLALPATARAGAIGALRLLFAFSLAIAVNLAGGRHPDCNGFGRLSSGPITGRTLVRNGGLMILAGAAAHTEAARLAELL